MTKSRSRATASILSRLHALCHPEFPWEFWFAPLGSLITAGARLMLALLDNCISTLRGPYVMEDTDSMAIVATAHGGLVPCPGGPFRMPDGRSAVRALSWREVAEIVARFMKLNPYTDKSRSILKIERDNYDPETGKQRQVYCLAISSKRHALFLRDEYGNPVLLQKGVNNHEDRWSEHGLGHLRNPMNPESEDRDWIRRDFAGTKENPDSYPNPFQREIVFNAATNNNRKDSTTEKEPGRAQGNPAATWGALVPTRLCRLADVSPTVVQVENS